MKIKIMSYNILNGFCSNNKPYKVNKNRIKNFLKLIEKENPDILILCEAYFWPFVIKHNLRNLKDLFLKIYDSPVPAEDMFRWAPIILSKFPIKEENISKHYRNGIRGYLRIGKRKIIIDAVHPAPYQLTEKERELWVKEITKNKNSNYLICGDFNALSPEDEYNEKNLIKGLKQNYKRRTNKIVKGMLSRKTIKYLLGIGLVDTYKAKIKKQDYTYSTDYSKNDKDTLRIDYIFCSEDFKIIESGIIKNKLTEKASDHYPIYAILEI